MIVTDAAAVYESAVRAAEAAYDAAYAAARAAHESAVAALEERLAADLAGPLADRQNIVVTTRAGYAAPGAEVVGGLDEALASVRLPPPAFCIGGAELYRAALPKAESMHLTEIARPYDGDVAFPAYDRGRWREVARERRTGEDGLDYAFVTYERAD